MRRLFPWISILLVLSLSPAFAQDAPKPDKMPDYNGEPGAKAGQQCINPKDRAAMVWVQGGAFTMGNPEGIGWKDEHPAHQVTLTGFWMYTYEVTVARFRAFCQATGYPYDWKKRGVGQRPDWGWIDDHPMTCVSWDDARAYADWAGAALPTEAQWEYAARGLEGRNFPWGGTATAADFFHGWDEAKCANTYNSEQSRATHHGTWPVGSFPAGVSWCGAHDLAGNVWEWCADWYGPYPVEAQTDPTGPETGTHRVLRGCAWTNADFFDVITCTDYRCATRTRCRPDRQAYHNGFRCVIVPAKDI